MSEAIHELSQSDRTIRTLLLRLAYDGTDFHGWQTQPGWRTVQETVEDVLRRVTRQPVALIGSGRTDAGVHAAGQTAHFRTECSIPCRNLLTAVGSRLPPDVTLLDVSEVSAGFHATTSALSKLYRYRIHNSAHKPALGQRFAFHFWHPLALDRMVRAARAFLGTMDFSAVATKGSPRLTMVRTVLNCDVHRHGDEIRIDVEGSGFLYNQVRNMVGTLVEVGRGHWPAERVAEILASRDRSRAGPPAPACGLCLQWVRYPPELLRMPDANDHA